MFKKLGIIGSGNVGTAVAHLAVAAGLDVVLANSRGPETLTDLVGQLGDRASAASVNDAAHAADLVVVAIPFAANSALPTDALAGKIVLDTTNYYPDRDGPAPRELATVTQSELVQRYLASSRVVKVFNTILPHELRSLARPAASPERSALPIAGDDTSAKADITALLNLLGWDTVDAGTLADSWRMHLGSPVSVTPYLSAPGVYTDGGAPVPTDTVRQLLASATQ